MAQLAKNVSIDLVINTGDNFYQNGINSVKSSRWNTTFENVYKIPASWYSVLGNHDYLGNAADGSDRGTLSQINYTTASISKRWVMPWYYYTKLFIVGNQHSNFSVQVPPRTLFSLSRFSASWHELIDAILALVCLH